MRVRKAGNSGMELIEKYRGNEVSQLYEQQEKMIIAMTERMRTVGRRVTSTSTGRTTMVESEFSSAIRVENVCEDITR